MVEPPLGEPDMPSCSRRSARLDRELYCIVEQDMYPCDFDRRSRSRRAPREYFATCGLTAGRPLVRS